jgi:hypothetical protein
MLRDIPIKNWDEFEAFYFKDIGFHSGVKKKIKQKFNRRERRFIRKKIKEELPEYILEAGEDGR